LGFNSWDASAAAAAAAAANPPDELRNFISEIFKLKLFFISCLFSGLHNY
jgi:hypothetical protein